MVAEAFFHTHCPSCGAPVSVHSASAMTIVCDYCDSVLIRQDNALHDTGRDSARISHFSPIQIGTTGRFAAQLFTVVGGIVAQYDAGEWREWYVNFDDGSNGWLSEAGDLYVLVKQIGTIPDAPKFEEIIAGQSLLHYGKTFVASDVRNITLHNAAAQGELPFVLPEIWHNRVADWRCEGAFLTLDYADDDAPQAFLGKTVQLAELSLHNTRDDAAIRQSAGSLKGERKSSNCPHCGSPVQWITGITPSVICPSCHSDLSTQNNIAQVIKANNQRVAQQENLALPLGKTGVLFGHEYTVIGAVRYEELTAQDAQAILNGYPNEGVYPRGWWFEYLLFAPQAGFLWVIQTRDEWRISRTLGEFPRLNKQLNPQGSHYLYDYGGRVSFAVGAFYWHIRAGDVNVYRDYSQGNSTLCAERSANEWAWSKSEAIPYSRLAQWFHLSPNTSQYSAQIRPESVSRSLVHLMMAVFVIVNIPAWLMMSIDDLFFSWVISGIILMFIYQTGISSDE